MSERPEYVLDRVFEAPREMVWRAWTDPELLPRWYGPGAETIDRQGEGACRRQIQRLVALAPVLHEGDVRVGDRGCHQ